MKVYDGVIKRNSHDKISIYSIAGIVFFFVHAN